MIFNSNKPNWLKILLLSSIISIIFFYIYLVSSSMESFKSKQYDLNLNEKTGASIRKITDELPSHGLYEIKIDSATTILIYRGVESCTMIKK